jgi:hypothetical protein
MKRTIIIGIDNIHLNYKKHAQWSRVGASMLLLYVHCLLVTVLKLRYAAITDRFKVVTLCDLSCCYPKMFLRTVPSCQARRPRIF